MKKTIHIQRVEIKNLQNVCGGVIDLEKSSANITGIYGQNGSGKTTFIRALAILRTLLSGARLRADYADRITFGQSEAALKFDFVLPDEGMKIFYQVFLKKVTTASDFGEDDGSLAVSREVLSYSKLGSSGGWARRKRLLEFKKNSASVILPKVRYDEFNNGKKQALQELQVAKGLSARLGTSFMFLEDTIKILEKYCKSSIFTKLIFSLRYFGLHNLFVIENRDSGLINLNAGLPFSFKFADDASVTMGTLIIALDQPSAITMEKFEIVTRLISDMNRVLENIVPGLNIKLKNLGKQLLKNGEVGVSVDLASTKKGTEIPFRFESDGIKKIVSVLHMLIETYNNPSMTLVIDELDSGVFEYMLGELLQSFEESGSGQLIFTSHNLRPMELLDKSSVVVSTANPCNRYIRLKNIKTNNNTKNVFLRDIVLDGQSETIYEPTNIFEIKHAFRSLRRR